jgi:hypothetical protein
MANDLKIINFSNGIRSEEIQYNFSVIEQQIAKERLAVSGNGISYGINMTINDFKINISEGGLVGIDGREIFMEAIAIDIELPVLKEVIKETCTVSTDGKVYLKNVPYSTTRRTSSEYEQYKSGIVVTDYNNASKVIPVINIDDNITIVSSIWAGQLVNVKYSYSGKRYDTIYVDDDYKIKVAKGIMSTSPSVAIPNSYKYLLGFVEVDAYAINASNEVAAKISVKKDLKSYRNVYTDSNNQLFLCGVPFKDLQIIHAIEPINPAENTIWYDAVSNKLRIWKIVDGISKWEFVNDTSVVPNLEYKIWAPEENPGDLKTFMFGEDEINLRFHPGKNEVEILVDQMPLHSDQFEEIILTDIDGTYENVGVGFRLEAPLERAGYVEVRITHRVNENPQAVRFQRTATFVSTGHYVYSEAEGILEFETNAPYRYGENQLEIFIEGKRLINGIDYKEGMDIQLPVKGNMSRVFKILRPILNNDLIAYKISSSIYSYDHLNKILDDIHERIEIAEDTVLNNVNLVSQLVIETEERLDTLEESNVEHASFVKNTDKLSEDNLPDSIITNTPKGIINISITKTGTIFEVPGIAPEDFIVMFDIQGLGGNSILRKGIDYQVQITAGKSYINFINPSAVEDLHTLYIIGIKFSN